MPRLDRGPVAVDLKALLPRRGMAVAFVGACLLATGLDWTGRAPADARECSVGT
jgi:hypothetical protein